MSATEARGKLVVDITTPLHVQETAKGRAQGGTVSKLRQWYFLPLSLITAFRLHLSAQVDKAISSFSHCADGTQAARGHRGDTRGAGRASSAAHLAFDGALRTLLRFPGLDEVSEYGFVLT